jgi:hypothetical protein
MRYTLTNIVSLTAIMAVSGLTFYGLSKGFDGTALLSAVVVIGGIAGYHVSKGGNL